MSVVPRNCAPGVVPLLPPSRHRPPRPEPEPLKLAAVTPPLKTGLPLSRGTLAESRASASVPVRLVAGSGPLRIAAVVADVAVAAEAARMA